MGKIEGMLRSEILRLARRETKKAFGPVRKDLRVLKGTLLQLRKTVEDLQSLVARQPEKVEVQEKELAAPSPPPEGTKLPPRMIRSLRKRLGLTQRQLAKLAKVTVGAVYQWESGKFEPREDKKAFLISLRSMKKDEVKRILEAEAAGQAPKKKKEEEKKTEPSSSERRPSKSVTIQKKSRIKRP